MLKPRPYVSLYLLRKVTSKHLELNMEPHVLLLTQRHIDVADVFIVTQDGIPISVDYSHLQLFPYKGES
jgi:hypothetical protein